MTDAAVGGAGGMYEAVKDGDVNAAVNAAVRELTLDVLARHAVVGVDGSARWWRALVLAHRTVQAGPDGRTQGVLVLARELYDCPEDPRWALGALAR